MARMYCVLCLCFLVSCSICKIKYVYFIKVCLLDVKPIRTDWYLFYIDSVILQMWEGSEMLASGVWLIVGFPRFKDWYHLSLFPLLGQFAGFPYLVKKL